MKLPFEKIKREILVRKEIETSDKFGFYPDKRPISEHLKYGLVNVDKPSGPTSHQVVSYVKNILDISKAGHSGTLDPAVTGVLPVALSKATRIVELLLTSGKEYVAIMHLHKDVDEKKIREVAAKFVGRLRQLPPVRSAIKRQWRYRTVYYLEIIEIKDRDVLFRVGCQAGTYIRKLISDMGAEMGGAHMQELRRTKAGGLDESTIHTLQDLKDAYHYCKEDKNEKFLRKVVMPFETATLHVGKVYVMDTTVDSLCHGAALNIPGIAKVESGIEKNDIVAVMTLKGELIGYGKAVKRSEDMLKEKGSAVDMDKIFMETGLYPRNTK